MTGRQFESQHGGRSTNCCLRPSPTLSLPPEVLCEIFSYLIHTDARVRRHCDPLLLPDPEDVDEDAPPMVDLTVCPAGRRSRDGCDKYCSLAERWNHLVVMRVCKRFQAVALAYAPWWQNVMLFNPSIARMCIERSNIHHLYVDYAEGHPWSRLAPPRPDVKALQLTLLKGMSRIRELSLQVNDRINLRHLFASKCEPLSAPLLEKLSISFPSSRRANLMLCTPSLFDMGTPPPRLRLLNVSHVNVGKTPNLFTASLFSLSLYGSFGPWESTDDMIRILSNLPLLEHLSLKRQETFPEDMQLPFTSSSTGNKLSSSLRRLDLTANVNTITNFLDCFHFPLSTSLSLELLHECQVPDNIERLLEFFERHFNIALGQPKSFTRAAIYLDYRHETTFEIRLACNAMFLPTLPPQLCIRYNWSKAGDPEVKVIEWLATQIYNRLPLSGVRQMRRCEIGRADDLGFEGLALCKMWWQPFACMSELRDLCVEVEPTDFLQWMDDQEMNEEVETPFPLLEKLTLHGVDLHEPTTGAQSSGVSSSDDDERPWEDPPTADFRSPANSDTLPTQKSPLNPEAVDDIKHPSPGIWLRELVTWWMEWQAKNGRSPCAVKMLGCKIGQSHLREMFEDLEALGATVEWGEDIEDADCEVYDI